MPDKTRAAIDFALVGDMAKTLKPKQKAIYNYGTANKSKSQPCHESCLVMAQIMQLSIQSHHADLLETSLGYCRPFRDQTSSDAQQR
jgi:hypothetical protein